MELLTTRGGNIMKSFAKTAACATLSLIAISTTAIPAKAQEFINILTGGTSGVYYPLGVGLSKIYGEKIPGVKVQVQATKASRWATV
jgi:uncharacterized protein